MIQKIRKMTFMVLFCVLFFNSECFSYDNEHTHQNINENAALQSTQLYMTLRNLGFIGDSAKELLENNIIYGLTIKFWLREGGKAEDEPVTRTLNHFHDPTKAWSEAGVFTEIE